MPRNRHGGYLGFSLMSSRFDGWGTKPSVPQRGRLDKHLFVKPFDRDELRPGHLLVDHPDCGAPKGTDAPEIGVNEELLDAPTALILTAGLLPVDVGAEDGRIGAEDRVLGHERGFGDVEGGLLSERRRSCEQQPRKHQSQQPHLTLPANISTSDPTRSESSTQGSTPMTLRRERYLPMPKRLKRVALGVQKPPQRIWPRHRRWVKSHGCCVPGCQALEVEFAHIRFGIGLCWNHHREQHQIGQGSFEDRHGIDLDAIAAEFARTSPDHKMRQQIALLDSLEATNSDQRGSEETSHLSVRAQSSKRSTVSGASRFEQQRDTLGVTRPGEQRPPSLIPIRHNPVLGVPR